MNHNRVFYTTSLALCSGSKANDPSDAFSRSAVGPDACVVTSQLAGDIAAWTFQESKGGTCEGC